MSSQATFLLSFDCEGKWGLVDCLSPRHRELFTSARLLATYVRLAALLREYRIDATFAFTAAFCMAPQAFARLRPEVERTGARQWTGRALEAIDRDGHEGWLAPECFEAVRRDEGHEIASHGFSHLPWHSDFATREILDAELGLCRSVPAFTADKVGTFVFPRNQVAHPELLLAHGFRAYRKARVSSRLLNLASEFNLRARCEAIGVDRGPLVKVPAGYFLNWRHGLRRGVPAAVTVRRWKNIIRDAANTGGVVHAWTHPENFLDGDDMFAMLEGILRFVAAQRDAGRLGVLTMNGYAADPRVNAAAPVQPAEATPEPAEPAAAPVVSIGMPVLNGGEALRGAVGSLLAQTFTDWELLLIDDGSTDGQTDAIAAYADPRIRVIKDGRNRGLSARLNEAIDMARGRYFARMDHDDICHPDRFRLQVAALEADAGIDLLATQAIRVSDELCFTGYLPNTAGGSHEEICRRPWLRIPMNHPSWMGRIEWFRRFRYPEPAPYYAEDFELLLRSCGTSRFAVLPHMLLAYRVRNSVELKKSFRARKTQYGLQRSYFLRTRSPAGLVLASAVFVLRVGFDVYRVARQALGLSSAPRGRISDEDTARWTAILKQAGLTPFPGEPPVRKCVTPVPPSTAH
jgi:peptidoglycan/xylan/chitin deacetylase (PgdA/CDA1 family)